MFLAHLICSSILLLVTLLITRHKSRHYQSVTNHTSFWCASGCNCSESLIEQREGAVNVSLNCFVRIKLSLIIKNFSKFCRSLNLHSHLSPLLPRADSWNPNNFFHFPTYLKNYWPICQEQWSNHQLDSNPAQMLVTVWRVNNWVKIRNKSIKLKYIY